MEGDIKAIYSAAANGELLALQQELLQYDDVSLLQGVKVLSIIISTVAELVAKGEGQL